MTRRFHSFALTIATLAAATAFAAPAAAHDLWLEVAGAAEAAGSPGTTRTVDVRVGDAFPGDALPWRPAATVRFAVVGPAGERPVEPLAGVPAARFAIDRRGDHAVVFRSGEAPIELPAEKFEAYLLEEGLEAVAAQREVDGHADRPGRELYSRSVKALIRAAGAGAPEPAGQTPSLHTPSIHTRPTGLALELVPAASPYDLAAGEDLELVLLWQGEPLAGALVEAVRREQPAAVYSGRTDARGVVRLPATAPGFWRLSAVHMQAADDREADWRSVWSTLTYSLD